jgi:hypothetical protein
MKEASRQRITHCLEQLDAWRASGMPMVAYVQSIDQNLPLWRGWLTWETRWRRMLATDLPGTSSAFVQAHGPKRTARPGVAPPPNTSPLVLEVSRAGNPLRVSVQWPLHATQQSVAWLREVLA